MKILFRTFLNSGPNEFLTGIKVIHPSNDCIDWVGDTEGYEFEPALSADLIVTVKEGTIIERVGNGIARLSRPEKETQ